MILEIVSVQRPLLFRMSISSLNAPTQQFPKLPVFAIASASRGAGAKPETATLRAPAGSLLSKVKVALLVPKVVGWNRRVTRVESPEPIRRGAEI